MKKLILIIGLTMAFWNAGAQNCDAIVLPYFGGDTAKMAQYRAIAPEKFEYRCVYATNAFYESDTIPADADVFPISSVQSRFSQEFLSNDYVVDLYTLSYYAYNFVNFQMNYPSTKVLCFTTPSSTHPYLVLRSQQEMLRIANEWWANQQIHY